MIKKTCAFCEKEFETTRSKQLYCPEKHIVKCFGCGEDFTLNKPRKGRKLYSCGNDECTIKLRKHSMIEKYGVDNPGKAKK